MLPERGKLKQYSLLVLAASLLLVILVQGVRVSNLATGISTQNNSLYEEAAQTSKYGYVTAYSGDDEVGHSFLLTLSQGYTLKKLDPIHDRILLIPKDFNISIDRLKKLRSVYTHIKYRDNVHMTENPTDKDSRSVKYWFKLNAWTVTGYEKLLWTGTDVLFIRDPSVLFEWVPPAAAIDYHIWGLSRYGAAVNGDCVLLSPSMEEFNGMRELGKQWAHDPSDHAKADLKQGEAWPGPCDQGLIAEFYRGSIATFPSWVQYELPGSDKAYYRRWEFYKVDQRVLSFHFPSNNKPWRWTSGFFSDLFAHQLQEVIDHFQLKTTLKAYGIKKPKPITLVSQTHPLDPLFTVIGKQAYLAILPPSANVSIPKK